MHGAIAMRHRKLNDALGTLAISLYAWFDFSMLHEHVGVLALRRLLSGLQMFC